MNYWYLAIGLFIFYLIRKFFNGPATNLSKDMKDKIIVITGASAGIGKETAKNLLIHNAIVIFANRDEIKTNKVIVNMIKNHPEIKPENAIFMKLELSSLQSVSDFAKQMKLKFPRIDILINNAGITNDKFIRTEDGVEAVFQINHLSHTVLSSTLIDLLKNSEDGRIITVGSDAHKFTQYNDDYFLFEERTFQTWNSYCVSKLSNVLMTYKLRDYCDKNNLNIKAVCIHPGAVYTEISRPETKLWYNKLGIYLIFIPIMLIFFRNEEMGAQTTLHCCYLEKENLVSGGYYSNNKLSNVSSKANDEKFKNKILSITNNLIKNSRVYSENLNNINFVNLIDNLA